MAERADASGIVREEQRQVAHAGPPFDRIAFTLRALRVLRPSGLTVAVCTGRRDVEVARGREWSGAPGDRWAVLAVAPDASRERIAVVVADLAGAAQDPYVLALLLADVPPTGA